jgi:predicted Zn-dependent protease
VRAASTLRDNDLIVSELTPDGGAAKERFHRFLAELRLAVDRKDRGRYPNALAIMRDFVAQAPVRPWGHAMLAMILAQLGRTEEAKTETAETLRLDATFTVSAKSVAAFQHPDDHEHFFNAWRRAGFL